MLKILVILILFGGTVFADENIENLIFSSPDYIKSALESASNSGFDDTSFFEKIVSADIEADSKVVLIDQIVAAKKNGYFVDSYVSKILEGLAKNVDGKSIERAVEKLNERFKYAHQIADKLAISRSKKELFVKNIVDGLSSGIKWTDYDKLTQDISKIQNEQFYMEVTLFAKDLSRVKLDSNEIAGLLSEMAQKGYSYSDASIARQSFRTNLKSNSSMSVFSGLKNAVSRGLKGSELGKGIGKGAHSEGKGGDGNSGGGGKGGGRGK